MSRSIPFPIKAGDHCPAGSSHTPNEQLAHDLLQPDSEKGYSRFSFTD